MIGYFGNKGTDLNIVRNYNQLINGVKPYPALSASSPIFSGPAARRNILVQDSDGNSNYNALWVTANKRFAKGLQFNASYTFSKSIDDNSRNNQGLDASRTATTSATIAACRISMPATASCSAAIYNLPFKGNRLVEGWEVLDHRAVAERQSDELPHHQHQPSPARRPSVPT